jgi:hypothetical protein
MVQRPDRFETAKFSTARKLAELDRRLRIYRDSQGFRTSTTPLVGGFDIGEDGIRFRNFF